MTARLYECGSDWNGECGQRLQRIVALVCRAQRAQVWLSQRSQQPNDGQRLLTAETAIVSMGSIESRVVPGPPPPTVSSPERTAGGAAEGPPPPLLDNGSPPVLRTASGSRVVPLVSPALCVRMKSLAEILARQSVEPAVVRKDTCPNDCGFEGDPNAVFDHRSICLKGQDKLSSRVSFYGAPHDVQGGPSGGDRPSQTVAKARLAVEKRYKKARSLKADGRTSSDAFQPNEGAYNYSYGNEDRNLDERHFAEENSILHDFENGRLLNPYDCTGSEEGGSPGVHGDEIHQLAGGAAEGARPKDPRRDPRLG